MKIAVELGELSGRFDGLRELVDERFRTLHIRLDRFEDRTSRHLVEFETRDTNEHKAFDARLDDVEESIIKSRTVMYVVAALWTVVVAAVGLWRNLGWSLW